MRSYDLYIEGKHSECKHCVNRKTNPIWGHVLCSEHRVCTEQTFWNPKCCPTCLGQRHQMTFNSQAATINSFKELRVMLRGTRWKLSIQFPDQPWEYEPQIDEFLSDFISLDYASANRRYKTDKPEPISSKSYWKPNNDVYSAVTDAMNNTVKNTIDAEMQSMVSGEYSNEFVNMNLQCTKNDCRNNNQQAQCTDPIHENLEFQWVSPTTLEPPNKKLKVSSASGSSVTRSTETQTRCKLDPVTNEAWIIFDPLLHTKISHNKIQVTSSDEMGFTTQRTVDVMYKNRNEDLFRIRTNKLPHKISPYTDTNEAYNSFSAGFTLAPSEVELPNKTLKLLDSNIEPDSGLATILNLIKEIDCQLTRTATGMKPEDLINLFPNSAFGSNIFINFTSGWSMTEEAYNKFAKDKDLDVHKFEDYLRVLHGKYKVEAPLLKQERQSRQNLVHNLSISHLLELTAKRIDEIPEDIRNTHKLSALFPNAIARMMTTNIKIFVSQWMIAKMKVRKSLISDTDSHAVVHLLKSSLWDPEIFPKSAFDELRLHGSGKDVENMLKLKKPESKFTQNRNFNKNNRRNFQQTDKPESLDSKQTQSQGGNNGQAQQFPGKNSNPFPNNPQSGGKGSTKGQSQKSNFNKNRSNKSNSNRSFDKNKQTQNNQKEQEKQE